jgi:hypothetical protein
MHIRSRLVASSGIRKRIVQGASDRAMILVNVMLDLVLLAIWLILLRLYDLATSGTRSHSRGDWDIEVGKVFFAVSVLAAIALVIYWDIKTIYRDLKLRFRSG